MVQDKQSLPEALGNRTLLASALNETLQRNLGRPLSAIVVMSDGRSQDALNTTTLRQIQSMGVPVFTIPLGDPNGMNDQAVVSVEAPQTGFYLIKFQFRPRLQQENQMRKFTWCCARKTRLRK